jgi:hypothetical protein
MTKEGLGDEKSGIRRTRSDIRLGFVYERVPDITLKSTANNRRDRRDLGPVPSGVGAAARRTERCPPVPFRFLVILGLVQASPRMTTGGGEDVDGRDKHGHDDPGPAAALGGSSSSSSGLSGLPRGSTTRIDAGPDVEGVDDRDKRKCLEHPVTGRPRRRHPAGDGDKAGAGVGEEAGGLHVDGRGHAAKACSAISPAPSARWRGWRYPCFAATAGAEIRMTPKGRGHGSRRRAPGAGCSRRQR